MIRNSVYWLAFFSIVIFGGCASYRMTANRPQTATMIEEIEDPAGAATVTPLAGPAGALTLAQALRLAFARNTSLGAALLEIRAAEARTLQVGLYPNMELEVELENLAGSGTLRGFNGTESSISLRQPVVLAGKRRKQVEKAALQSDLAAWEAERMRLDLYAAVHNAFNRLLIAQEDIVFKEELLALSEQLLEITARRVDAGKVSAAEASRAQVIVAQNRIALERARRLLATARQQLAATWGSRDAHFSTVQGEYDLLFTLPTEDSLQVRLSQNPDIARYETAVKQRRVAIALEDAMAIPDPTLSGGVRHLNESGDVALVVGLSIPLPIADRNQGRREEARYNLAKIEKEQQAMRTVLSSELTEAYNLFQAIQAEVLALKDQIIPQAESAYQRINEGYLQGRFDFLDVLDAQRTLFESKDRYLHALREFHETVVRMERLIAQKIH